MPPVLGSQKAESQSTVSLGANSTSDTHQEKDSEPVIKSVSTPRRIVKAEHEWEGVVTELDDTEFTVLMREFDDDEPLDAELATFDVQEVSPSDLPLLKEGAIVRWIIGSATNPDRSIERISRLVFRRMPIWRKTDLQKIADATLSEFDELKFE